MTSLSNLTINSNVLHRLCGKSDAERLAAAQEFYEYLTGELNENPQDVVQQFADHCDRIVSELISSPEANDRKGGIFIMVCLIKEEKNVAGNRFIRFANYLRSTTPFPDFAVMELAARAIGHLALAYGSLTSEYVSFEIKRSFEWLQSSDRVESRRYCAVLILKEIARATPTFFFQHIHQFFSLIFNAIKDAKCTIREEAAVALRAALVVTLQRETKQEQKDHWYKQCYDEAESCFEEFSSLHGFARDEKAHSGLLIFNELLRISNLDGEKIRQEVRELNDESGLTSKNYKSASRFLFSRLKTSKIVRSHRDVDNVFTWLIAPPKSQHFESRTCRKHVTETYEKIISWALKCRSCKQPFDQSILLQILPRLAAFDVQIFVSSSLNDSVAYILHTLTKDKDKNPGFTALGLITLSVKQHISQHLPKIFDIIRQSLQSKDTAKRKIVHPDPAVFTCLALLARSLGKDITSQIKSILEPSFATGLSFGLTVALKEIAARIPELKTDIHDGLQKQLSLIIMHRPMPSKLLPPQPVEPPNGPVTVVDISSTTLALSTLGKFQFPRHSVENFLRYITAGYLCSEHREVRLEAVRAVTRLLLPFVQQLSETKNKQQHLPLLKLVHEVIEKLLIVGITDSDPEIRLCVFQSLMEDELFFMHLAQAEMLQIIFMGLQDEQYEIRETVICTLGRLSDINPAIVMPTLRRVLIQVLGELSNSGVTRNEEQSARMLAHLIASSPRFMRPYMPSTLKALVHKLKVATAHGDVIVNVLHAIGELSIVGGAELIRQKDVLAPMLIEFMQDPYSVEKREVALWTFGQMIESTGYVVEPYQKYPDLMPALFRLLKTEQVHSVRSEIIRLLGSLGALDPHKQRIYSGRMDLSTKTTTFALSMPDSKNIKDTRQETIQWFHWEKCTLEEFYPAFAIANLMHIMSDSTLSQHHTGSVQAVMIIFKSLGAKCLPFLDQGLPIFMNVIRTSDTAFREFLFQQLGVLISVVQSNIKSYLKDIFALIKEFWTPQTPMKNTMIMLIEQLASALGSEFKAYVPELMPAFLRVFMLDNTEHKSVTLKLLETFNVCGSILEEHLHLIVPPILKLLDTPGGSIELAKAALDTLSSFAERMNLSQYASRIVHTLCRTLDTVPEIRLSCFHLLQILMIHMGSDYLVFARMIDAVMQKHKLSSPRYENLLKKLEKEGKLYMDEDVAYKKKINRQLAPALTESADAHGRKLRCNFALLQKAWAVNRCVSKEDWIEWLRRFSIELLKEAPFPALRACWSLAQNYYPLAKELFNAAFTACWTELSESLQDDLISCLQQALNFQEGPEITQTILNLAEFMDHSEKGPLLVDPKLLGERALKTRAYAKALRYMEAEFHKAVYAGVLEALISINNKLQLHEAASGVVEYARKKEITVAIRERWYEKLHEWEKALDAYERKQEQNPNDIELSLGRMRCLEALGEWGKLHTLVKEKWETSNIEIRQRMAKTAAASAWGQGQWDCIDEYIRHINQNTLDGSFFRAVKFAHENDFASTHACIEKARDIIDTELTSMAAESYNRAYGTMVTVQILNELEEAVQFKITPERRAPIAQMWTARLNGVQDSVEDWQRFLQVRSLVLSPLEMRKTWIKFASLCRKSNKSSLAYKTLATFGLDTTKTYEYATTLVFDKPDLTYCFCKQLWHDGKQDAALAQLKLLVDTSLKSQILQRCDVTEQHELIKLKAKCYLKLGQWREANRKDNEPPLLQVMQHYRLATEWDRNWYKAWHALACTNFSAILYYKQQINRTNGVQGTTMPSPISNQSGGDAAGCGASSAAQPPPIQNTIFLGAKLSPESLINTHAIQAVQCFFRSISLCKTNSLQDTLRLLTLWFDYGQNPEVYDALMDGIKTVRVETWLHVIPQLIARIDTPRQLVSRLIMQLLIDVGKDHPQALVCPLTVAAKSNNKNRALVATRILNHISDHSPNLVLQASLLSEELIRVAILWHELWHEGLEEASRQYFAEHNVQGMFNTLEPLHNMIEVGPTTLKEQSFTQAYLRDLKEAKTWCEKYKSTGNVKELTQAWDLYYNVFRKISKQLPQLTTLELHYVSPKLLLCRGMELAVPGTYDPDKPVVRVQSIHASLQVITSKQRPRKVCIKGSDGNDYWFLLKGHEDPRQDERVMQLFGLVNTLLLQDPATCRRNLTIQRYSVIPLSQNSGLIGWVPNCDTLHALLRDYREKKKILLNIEHKLMQRMAPDYDHLTLMQKVEVFEHALEHTTGDDLQKILWLKSPSSEVWFDRRTNYTRSLATMSMVGYILGLGDRHPSNLMLDRMSGKIVHIDFGDCFEVAMTREKFPEKIPFRLTRMLVNAMEVTGIEGNFRITCERVMSVLREHKESVIAVLEAFVYDPLINWRLVEQCVITKKVLGDTVSDALRDQDELGGILGNDDRSRLCALANDDDLDQPTEVGNKRALDVVQRIRDKLAGRDFSATETFDVATQVDLLIEQSISHENLCQCYIGWCPFW